MLQIIRGTTSNVDQIAPLFDRYRIFYGQKSDIEGARTFLKKRLSHEESIVLLATLKERSVGFAQLYTTYSSVSLQPYYILNDLYVEKEFRAQGIGHQLLEAAKDVCRANRYKGMALETARDNPAQFLYEKMDWKKDRAYLHYFWTNTEIQIAD